jgi:hypothetical protein
MRDEFFGTPDSGWKEAIYAEPSLPLIPLHLLPQRLNSRRSSAWREIQSTTLPVEGRRGCVVEITPPEPEQSQIFLALPHHKRYNSLSSDARHSIE